MKKGQGISFNLIVMAIIAITVLALILVFATGGFSELFGKTLTLSESTQEDIIAEQTKCSQLCISAQAKSVDDQSNSRYCTSKIFLNLDGDDANEEYKCTSSEIDSTCPGVECEEAAPPECTALDNCNTADCVCPAATPTCDSNGDCIAP